MTALALKKISLSHSEELLKESILDHILESFCENCPALRYEFDTGSWECPCGNDPDEPDCYRGSEWSSIQDETDNFLDNIKSCW